MQDTSKETKNPKITESFSSLSIQKDVWKKYITAQSKILEHKSRPIRIDSTKSIELDGLKLHLSIDQEVFKQVFKKEVEEIFTVKDFNFDNGYILASIADTSKITVEKLNKLKEYAEICYINFNENPLIEGAITGQGGNIKDELKNVVGELPSNYHFKNSGQIFLTLDERRALGLIQGLSFNKKAGAVFQIKPSISFLISSYYRNIDISQNRNTVTVKGELHSEVFELFQKHFDLNKRSNQLVFEFENSENLKQRIEELDKVGITLGKAQENKLVFEFSESFYEHHESDLLTESFRLKQALKKYFPQNDFTFSYHTVYSYDFKKIDTGIYELEKIETVFWNRLFSEIHGDVFQISQTHRTISCDFETSDELTEKLNFIKSVSFFEIYDRGEKHKFKFNLKFETGLHELQTALKKEFPVLQTKLISNGEKLIFRQFYQSGNKSEILARLRNRLDNLINPDRYDYVINDTFKEKYLCEENFELKVEQEEEKLSKLLREEFYFGDSKEKFYLGSLRKVEYPELFFVVEEDRIEEVKKNISNVSITAIFPNLKGEKDKIKRLEDTVSKLDDEKAKLPNDNAKEFLYDASKAKCIENIDSLLNKESGEWQDFENNLFSKSLNESQKQAIYKSLYASELALIQGPPGTGKSTAIAEIIWQHIRKQPRQKILLTSETNLAVDNAIDKLKNEQSNIVKPIRFGNTENLESEGYFYSLEAINDWQKLNSSQCNTVSHWLSNITNRISIQDNEQIDAALDKWRNHLQKPDIETKRLFADKYLEYVNLIGATGSSIGKLNSEDGWTSFFRTYLKVFDRKNYEAKKYWACNRTEIHFDTVIMDEASKATPPELALPVLFAKKSVIVGDHRQLPPLIDGEEIKDILISIGENQLARTLSQKDFQISQFERLFLSIHESLKGTFNTQYRMHPAINEAITPFYRNDGGLNCGLPLDESSHSSFDRWDSRFHGLSFRNIITPETHTIWVDVTTPEIQVGTSRVNVGEVNAIDDILCALKYCEGKEKFDEWVSKQTLEQRQIGIISFYGKQIHYINSMLKEKHHEVPIRLSTVDRFQGMERNIIIVSMVRSNKIASFPGQQPDEIHGELGYPLQESLGFAESPNRLNVALSRARRLLIIVGNSEHFSRKDIYKQVYDTIKENGKIVTAEELRVAVEENE